MQSDCNPTNHDVYPNRPFKQHSDKYGLYSQSFVRTDSLSTRDFLNLKVTTFDWLNISVANNNWLKIRDEID